MLTRITSSEHFDFRDTPEKAITRIRSIIKDTADLESAFAHMQAVVTFLIRFNIKRKVYINPLSSYNEKFYRGNFLFQCLYDQKKRSVLAAGGRYDQLITDHQLITSKKKHIYAVGFQLAWTGLCADMVSYLKLGTKSKAKRKPPSLTSLAWSKRRCDILIDSFDQGLLGSVGIDILHELWSNGISAELAEEDHGTTSENAFAKGKDGKEDHSWIVLIKSEDSMKIKTASRKDEIEVRLADLTSHLRSEIRERDRVEGRTPRATLLQQNSQQDVNSPETDREVDIKVLTSQNKGKKVNRKTIVEEGEFFHKTPSPPSFFSIWRSNVLILVSFFLLPSRSPTTQGRIPPELRRQPHRRHRNQRRRLRAHRRHPPLGSGVLEAIHPERRSRRAPLPRPAAESPQDYGGGGGVWICFDYYCCCC